MRRGLAAALTVALAAGQVWASPPGDSPRPALRPSVATTFPASPAAGAPGASAGAVALPQGAARPLVTLGDDGALRRPLPRPDVVEPMIPDTAAQSGMPSGTQLAAVRPQARPRLSASSVARIDLSAAPEKLVPVAAIPLRREAVPGTAQGARGALCGIPGLSGRPIAPITSRISGCGLENGVEVTHVSGIPLSIPAQIDCGTAAALKGWVDRGIVPAVGTRGGGVAELEIAGSYACRPRNNQSGAKVSEHGRGRAVDLSGIRLRSGEVITVEQHWQSKYGPMLQKIHAMACGPFGTVLGPKADRFHHDHIHVDTAQNRNGAYCR